MKIHIVQKGDTLWKIAKKYGVNFEELKTMNAQLSNPDMIMPGMKIKVPTTGGTIKKEAAGAKKESPINFGTKKEMPKAEHPFKEEKPKTMPVTEKPVEKPKPKPKPYTPKMPQPVIPEIDINNYYMMNMANMQTQPKEKPKMPPKPTNILPKPKEEKVEIPKQQPIKESVKGVQQQEESLEIPTQPQGGFTQPMFFNPNYCVPVSPVMPGPGYGAPYGGMPGGYGPSHGAVMPGNYGGPGGYPMGQVQGASTFPGMHQGLPGVENQGMMHGMGYDDESSSIMPYMHQMPMHGGNPSEVMGAHAQQPMGYPTGVMGASSQQPMGYPTDVMGAYGQQPMGQPTGVMGVQDEEDGYPSVQMPQMGQMPQMPTGMMPQGPFNDNCYPVSPVMPGSGFHGMNPYGGVPGAVQGVQSAPGGYGMPGMHGGYPGGYPMGQVQGAMMDESPMMQHGYMPEDDCGCGGPKAVSPMAQMPVGQMPMGQMPMGQPHMGQPYGHGMMGQGMPMGPGGYPQGGQGMFGPRAFGMPQVNDDDVEG